MGLTPEELERTYAVAAQRNFPFPARVKQVAERFGALKRGKLIAHPNLCSLPTRFEKTPIFEEALQETGRDLIDMDGGSRYLSLWHGGRSRWRHSWPARGPPRSPTACSTGTWRSRRRSHPIRSASRPTSG